MYYLPTTSSSMLSPTCLQFIKQQDKLFKEEHAKTGGSVSSVREFFSLRL